MPRFKPTFIQLPLDKMAGCPWNLLDQRGLRIAWCGTDGNHERDGELIANDILNLIAIGEAVDELHGEAVKKIAEKDARIEELEREVERLEGEIAANVGKNRIRNAGDWQPMPIKEADRG